MRARAHGEIVAPSAQGRQHRAGSAMDLVHGPGVATGDKQVAVIRVDRDRIDMEVVPRHARVGRLGVVGVGEVDVLVAAPLKQQAARGHVDLLDDAVEIRALAGAPRPGGQGRRGPSIAGEQRRTGIGQQELVQVTLVAVARAHFGHAPVGGVADVVVALPVSLGDAAPPPGQHRAA